MQTALVALDQALHHHEQWYEELHVTLICRLPPDERDVSGDAHRRCRFGQWYYGSGASELGHHPGFAEIATEHERMHQYAATLLRASRDGAPISVQEYEPFVSALKRMRLEILTMKREFEDALYNLDPLTSTFSRIGMLTKLREQQQMVQRKVHTCCLVMMDVDQFKVVNDTYGHVVGDGVLTAMANYVMAQLRPYDRVFRYGGEEFVICMPDADQASGFAIVERLREGLASMRHESKDHASFNVTASFGLTLLDPGVPVEQSIDRADRALYAAKSAGKNRTVLWAPSMSGPQQVAP